MEKILLALDAHRLPSNTIEFACYVAQRTHSKLTGLFLEDERMATPAYIPGSGDASYGDTDTSNEINVQTIRRFRQLCMDRHTLTDVHLDHGNPLDGILTESRSADLMIVDRDSSFGPAGRAARQQFIEDVLLNLECPVLVPPHDFRLLSEIIFVYRGKDCRFDTLRQFASLFDGLDERKLLVVTLLNTGKPRPEIMQWLEGHYRHLEFVDLKESVFGCVTDLLIKKRNTLFVLI